MIKIVKPDLDDLEFMGGSYELNQSNVNYFEKKLDRRFDLKKYVYDSKNLNSKSKDSSTHGSTLRVLLAGFNCLPVLGLYSPRCLPLLLYFSNVPWR
jgi:hypothetical protein